VHPGHGNTIDQQFDVRPMSRRDPVGGKLEDLAATRGLSGATCGCGQVTMLAPPTDQQVVKVKIEQPTHNARDLLAGRFPARGRKPS